MVKRNEKKVVVALSIALLLAFSLVASLIPGINSKAAGQQYGEVSLTFTAPTSGTVYNSNSDRIIKNSGVSVETTGVSHSVTVIGDKDDPISEFSSYPTKLQDNTEYGAVIVVQCDQPNFFGDEVTTNIQGATYVAKQIINAFDPSDPSTHEFEAIGIDVTKPALFIIATFKPTPSTDPVDPVDPVNPATPVTSASTDTNTVPATNQATPSADTTSNTTKATAPKTEDALPIVLIISIIGAGALTSVITIVSRKRQ